MGPEVLRRSKAARVELIRTDSEMFQVRCGDEILVQTKVQSYAEIAFDDAVDERTVDLQARRRTEQAQSDMRVIRESSMGKAGSVRRKGGWSGR